MWLLFDINLVVQGIAAIPSYGHFKIARDKQGLPCLKKTTELAYKRRSVHGERRLALGSCTQTTMIDIIGTRFIPCTR
jgi:hypothetical protein